MARDESEMNEQLLNWLVTKRDVPNCEWVSKKRFLTDVTFVPTCDPNPLWVFGLAEIDICLRRKGPDLDFTGWAACRPDRVHFKWKTSSNQTQIWIPLIAIEVKTGAGGTTVNELRSCNLVCEGLRYLFPFVHYLLVIESATEEDITIFRHTKAFTDRYLAHGELEEPDLVSIGELVSGYLTSLSRLGLVATA